MRVMHIVTQVHYNSKQNCALVLVYRKKAIFREHIFRTIKPSSHTYARHHQNSPNRLLINRMLPSSYAYTFNYVSCTYTPIINYCLYINPMWINEVKVKILVCKLKTIHKRNLTHMNAYIKLTRLIISCMRAYVLLGRCAV